MGALSQIGQGMATNASSGTDPASLARASMGYGAAGTLLGTTGSVLEGLGGFQQAKYAAGVSEQNRIAALSAGQEAEVASKLKLGTYAHEQITDAAGRGVGVSSGAVRNVVETTRGMSAFDAAILHYNAMREATQAGAEAALQKRAATGALASGLIKADTSFLGGAQALSQKWLQFKELGAPSNSQDLFANGP